jgi:hypothetical protein
MKNFFFFFYFLTSILLSVSIFPQNTVSSNPNLILPKDTIKILDEADNTERIIAEFSGNNIQNTRPFTANSSWEVQWDFNGEIFQIYLQSPKEELWEVLANQSGSGSGSSYYPKGGQYYFKVNAMGNWKIKVIKFQ